MRYIIAVFLTAASLLISPVTNAIAVGAGEPRGCTYRCVCNNDPSTENLLLRQFCGDITGAKEKERRKRSASRSTGVKQLQQYCSTPNAFNIIEPLFAHHAVQQQ
ncbi:hypothetical protein DL93DRAFT_2101880 [Clavulina sp. PMI_390]|nr:hypothetical protein DL93DRAFT_2101880 [Clavulina sp. PMI_390]